jgi:hypothetical protein
MEDDERLEHHLRRCQPTGGFDGSGDERSELTIEFGSRKRGARALQTSWMAPSSDHVAAMMGSMYCPKQAEGGT